MFEIEDMEKVYNQGEGRGLVEVGWMIKEGVWSVQWEIKRDLLQI